MGSRHLLNYFAGYKAQSDCFAMFHSHLISHKSLYLPQIQSMRQPCVQFSSTLFVYFTFLPLRTDKLVKTVCLLFRAWKGSNSSQTDGAEKEKLEKGQ
jgi:hypothetical protein